MLNGKSFSWETLDNIVATFDTKPNEPVNEPPPIDTPTPAFVLDDDFWCVCFQYYKKKKSQRSPIMIQLYICPVDYLRKNDAYKISRISSNYNQHSQ